jgi:hypothetical protein
LLPRHTLPTGCGGHFALRGPTALAPFTFFFGVTVALAVAAGNKHTLTSPDKSTFIFWQAPLINLITSQGKSIFILWL